MSVTGSYTEVNPKLITRTDLKHMRQNSLEHFLEMDLNELIDLERGPRSVLIGWLQRRYLLADPPHCAQCNQAMELTERNVNHTDGFLW